MDEFLLFFMAPIFGIALTYNWIDEWLGRGLPFGLPQHKREFLLGALFVAFFLLGAILLLWSADDVRTNLIYLLGYWGLGLAWLAACLHRLFPLMGLDPLHEALERRNTATLWAFGGAIFGATFCYAGGNIGDGPGWWVVLFCLLLATLHWLGFWWLLDATTWITDVITIDREQAAGMRLGAFLVGTGLIVGRAVAGDWLSLEATLYDFMRYGWPALVVLYGVAAVVEWRAQPTVSRPSQPIGRYGLLPASLYIGGALLFVVGSVLWRKGW